ncbi:MAG TPA: PspC domain-containing protein [Ornithinibacter sp.]|nr:PspC domain-containing protein [Ornithinibacter sp.]
MTQNLPPAGPPPSAPPPGAPPAGPSFLDDSFGRLRTSGFVRDSEARWFGGVCSGLAHRLGVDPILIRAAAIILTFVGGIGLTAYVLLWLLMPDRHGVILAERGIRHGDVGAIALLVLAGLLVFGGIVSVGSGDGWIAPLWLIPVALIAWFVLNRSGTLDGPPAPPPLPNPSGETMSAPPTSPPYGGYRTPAAGQYGAPYGGRPTPPVPPRPIAPPPPPTPRRRRPSAFIGLVSLGIAIIGIGLGAALDGPTGFPGSAPTLAFLIALTGVSLVVLVLGLRGLASGFSGFLVVALSFLLAISLIGSRIPDTDGVGERTWSPVPADGTTTFELGAGDAVLDLEGLVTTIPRTTPQTIEVDMGAGELTILVPEGLDARIDANVGFGSIRHTGSTVTDVDENAGTDRSTSVTIGDTPVEVVIDAELGLGQITIQEQ